MFRQLQTIRQLGISKNTQFTKKQTINKNNAKKESNSYNYLPKRVPKMRFLGPKLTKIRCNHEKKTRTEPKPQNIRKWNPLLQIPALKTVQHGVLPKSLFPSSGRLVWAQNPLWGVGGLKYNNPFYWLSNTPLGRRPGELFP